MIAGWNMEKLPMEAVSPKDAPVFDSIVRVAAMVVSMSVPCSATMRDETRNKSMYVSMNTVICDTTGAEMALPPTFTATTERGCILLVQPLQISFSITSILITLMPPDVEAAQPPMNINVIRAI